MLWNKKPPRVSLTLALSSEPSKHRDPKVKTIASSCTILSLVLSPLPPDIWIPEDPYLESLLQPRLLLHKDLYILEEPESPLLSGTERQYIGTDSFSRTCLTSVPIIFDSDSSSGTNSPHSDTLRVLREVSRGTDSASPSTSSQPTNCQTSVLKFRYLPGILYSLVLQYWQFPPLRWTWGMTTHTTLKCPYKAFLPFSLEVQSEEEIRCRRYIQSSWQRQLWDPPPFSYA